MDNPTFSDQENKLEPLFEQLDQLIYDLMAGLTRKDFEEDIQAWVAHFNREAKLGHLAPG